MMTRLVLILIATLASASAFVAPGLAQRQSLRLHESTAAVDAFDAYQLSTPSQTVVTRDEIVGTGDVVQEGDLIVCEYKGRLMANDKQFDEGGFKMIFGEPNRVMPGWTMGLKGMKIGGSRTLRIPPRFGYGARGAGDVIPPNADLEFDVKIVEKKEGALAEFQYKTGLGFNVKTGGILFFLSFLALSPMLPSK